MRQWIDLFEKQDSSELSRWVDGGGALSYIRYDAMIGRVRHWLPKQISGLDKIYPKTGLSFGLPNTRSNWNAHGQEGICFVVARNRVDNHICEIDGQAVYEFSDAYDHYKMGGGAHGLEMARDRAIEHSAKHPDEAFVLGNIRELHSKLIRIEIGNLVDPKVVRKVMAYAEKHGIEIR